MNAFFRLCLAPAFVLFAVSSAFTAEPAISLELVTEQGFRQEDARKWFALFEELNLTVRIRGGKKGDRVGLEAIGDPPTRYRITGILSPNNQLDFPADNSPFRIRPASRSGRKKLRPAAKKLCSTSRPRSD